MSVFSKASSILSGAGSTLKNTYRNTMHGGYAAKMLAGSTIGGVVGGVSDSDNRGRGILIGATTGLGLGEVALRLQVRFKPHTIYGSKSNWHGAGPHSNWYGAGPHSKFYKPSGPYSNIYGRHSVVNYSSSGYSVIKSAAKPKLRRPGILKYLENELI